MKRRIISTKTISAAETSKGQEAFEEAMDKLEDDFNYLMDGLEKMVRDGGDGQSSALQIVLEATSTVNNLIAKISSNLSE